MTKLTPNDWFTLAGLAAAISTAAITFGTALGYLAGMALLP